ncbi:MAG TPA: hypothetical protein PK087_02710 [Bacilli bacterium]|nr:hypothetical protein [Bacilli bacterium]
MKFKDILKSLILPRWMVKYKSMSIIIAICIFAISSFIIALPPSQNKTLNEQDILNNYNFNVLSEFPNTAIVNNVIKQIVDKECAVVDGKELKCGQMEAVDNFETDFSFVEDGITKNIHFVIDLFDIKKVYLEDEKIYYDVEKRFNIEKIPYQENHENYLIVFYSDALYFQAHPFAIDSLNINHKGHKLVPTTKKIFY